MQDDCPPLVQPDILPVADRLYRLDEDYVYCWTIAAGEDNRFAEPSEVGHQTRYRIIVPAGFTYDGASVPRLLWTLTGIRPDGLIRAAALVHDWLYFYEGRLPPGSFQYLNAQGQWENVIGRWSRRDADRLFGRMLREAGVARRRRRWAYRAVRAFGWIPWTL